LRTHLVLADDRVVAISVRNISPDGFMGECGTPLAQGAWLGIDMPGYGIARAVVRWSGDGEIGCKFRRKIDLARLGRARARGSSSAGLFATIADSSPLAAGR
jgi:hypothetical protein